MNRHVLSMSCYRTQGERQGDTLQVECLCTQLALQHKSTKTRTDLRNLRQLSGKLLYEDVFSWCVITNISQKKGNSFIIFHLLILNRICCTLISDISRDIHLGTCTVARNALANFGFILDSLKNISFRFISVV